MDLHSILGLQSHKFQGNTVTKFFWSEKQRDDEYNNLRLLEQQGVSVPIAYATTNQKRGFFNRELYGVVMSHAPGYDLRTLTRRHPKIVQYPHMILRSWNLLEDQLEQATKLGWTFDKVQGVYDPVRDRLTLTDVHNWAYQK